MLDCLTVRNYKDSDFSACVDIINHVWDFDTRFQPQQLSDVFKEIYVGGSLAGSNFSVVVERHNKIQGFLFGKCGKTKLHKTKYSGLIGNLKFMLQLFSVPGVPVKRKCYYVKIIGEHERNRRRVEATRANEVNLFAVDPSAQGNGYGKLLMNAFIEHCRSLQVKRITLETDKTCNYGFYQHYGFTIKGEFFSPLQQEYSGTSGESYVYELSL